MRESFEPDPIGDLTAVELHPDGDFTIAGRRRRQSDTDLLTAMAPPWVCSKVAGEGNDLLLTNMQSGEKRTYRYADGAWCRKFLWKHVASNRPFGLVGLFADYVHCNPSLERFYIGETFSRTISIDDRPYAVEMRPWRESLLSIALPDEQTHYFALRDKTWYEVFPSQRENEPRPVHPPHTSPPPLGVVDRDMVWAGFHDPRFMARATQGPGGGTVVEGLPGLEFFTDGAVTVGRSHFGPGESFDLDFNMLWFRRRGDLLQLDIAAERAPAEPADGQATDGRSDKLPWKSVLLRYHHGSWQAHLPNAKPDRMAEFWAEHGYWLSYVLVFSLLALSLGTAFRFLFDAFPWLERFFEYVVP